MQRLNHHHLYIFWIFGRTGSFTKTAEELSIAQSAVTAQLRSLEESLGLCLIDRTNPRRTKLTNEGRRVLEYADSIFESSRELINWATKGMLARQQILRIGAISGLSRNLQYEFIKPLLSRPEIRFEITTADQKTLVDQLGRHELDVMLTSHNVSAEYGGRIYVNVLMSTPVVFVVNKSVRLRSKESLRDRLAGRDVFLPGKNFEAKPELDAYLDSLKVKCRVAGEVDDIALLRIIALQSGAVVAVPAMGVKNDLTKGDLKILGGAKKVVQRFYGVTRQKLSPNDNISFLIESIRSGIRD